MARAGPPRATAESPNAQVAVRDALIARLRAAVGWRGSAAASIDEGRCIDQLLTKLGR